MIEQVNHPIAKVIIFCFAARRDQKDADLSDQYWTNSGEFKYPICPA